MENTKKKKYTDPTREREKMTDKEVSETTKPQNATKRKEQELRTCLPRPRWEPSELKSNERLLSGSHGQAQNDII